MEAEAEGLSLRYEIQTQAEDYGNRWAVNLEI